MHLNNKYSCQASIIMRAEKQPQKRRHMKKKMASLLLVNSYTRKKAQYQVWQKLQLTSSNQGISKDSVRIFE